MKYLPVLFAALSTQASAGNWPTTIFCKFDTSQTCKSAENCFAGHSSGNFPSNWRFELSQNHFEQFQIVDGKEVSNFSGGIAHQREREVRSGRPQLSLVLDTDQLVTLSPKYDSKLQRVDDQYEAVVQFARPDSSDTHWLSCRTA